MTSTANHRWYRAASACLILLAGVLLAAAYRVFSALEQQGVPAQLGQQLNALGVGWADFSANAWGWLNGVVLALPLVLFIFGASQWIFAREVELRSLRRHAKRHALLFFVGAWPVASSGAYWIAAAFLLTALLYLMAAIAPRGRSIFSRR